MKKADFDPAETATKARSRDLRNAERVLKKNQGIFAEDGIVGTWVGAGHAGACIMLAVNASRSKALRDVIPDSLDGIAVYYVEGSLTR
jgi:hypothetical protein